MLHYVPRDVTKDGRHVIKIGFFTPHQQQQQQEQPSCTACFYSIASWWTSVPQDEGRHYSHVELRFSDGCVTSVTQDPGTVHYINDKMMSSKGYRCFYQIAVSPQDEAIVQERAKWHAENKTPFGKTAMYWNFLPVLRNVPIRSQETSFFCSQYITTLLQMINLVPELDADLTSPNDLWRVLKGASYASISFNRELVMLKKSQVHLKPVIGKSKRGLKTK
jgi:hypothetical protein